jgi:hypothetical protein
MAYPYEFFHEVSFLNEVWKLYTYFNNVSQYVYKEGCHGFNAEKNKCFKLLNNLMLEYTYIFVWNENSATTYYKHLNNHQHNNRLYHLSKRALFFRLVGCFPLAPPPDTKETNKMQYNVENSKCHKVSQQVLSIKPIFI